MKEPVNERLYKLLPAIYRIRDHQEGEPLRALLKVIENEMDALEEDIDGLYEDCFIETCAEWAIPYIGDLLGVHGFHPLSTRAGSMRAYVGNTMAYRRRKGTVAVLQQVSRDVTGWPAHIVEFFQLLAVMQHLNHLRLDKARTACVRDAGEIEHANGPFESLAHTLDVRKKSVRGGKYNLSCLGIFLWRMQSFPLEKVTARKIGDSGKNYTFDPTGLDIPLFNRPQTEDWLVHRSEEINVPCLLRRYPIYRELEARRKDDVPEQSYFDPQPVFRIDLVLAGKAETHQVPLKDLYICDLSQWQKPKEVPNVADASDDRIPVGIDPINGRIALFKDVPPEKVKVLVSYSYGFSGDVGAGSYDRTLSIRKILDGRVDWQVGVRQYKKIVRVSSDKDRAEVEKIFPTLQEAFDEWNRAVSKWDKSDLPGKVGLIVVMDNQTYEENLTIKVPDGCKLLIVAADWPEVEGADGRNCRVCGQFAARGLRPHLQGEIQVQRTEGSSDSVPGELTMDGLLIEGELRIANGKLRLRLAHSTLVPGKGGIKLEGDNPIELTIYRSICAENDLSQTASRLIINESIIDNTIGKDSPSPLAINAEEAEAEIDQCTIIGNVSLRNLRASNCIFMGDVTVKQRQNGYVRYCSLPIKSRAPRCFRCLMSAKEGEVLEKDPSIQERNDLEASLRPVFTSLQYGDPGYAQLSRACAKEIRTGAEDGTEMGVFGILKQPLLEANLQAALQDYMKYGLDAEIFYVN